MTSTLPLLHAIFETVLSYSSGRSRKGDDEKRHCTREKRASHRCKTLSRLTAVPSSIGPREQTRAGFAVVPQATLSQRSVTGSFLCTRRICLHVRLPACMPAPAPACMHVCVCVCVTLIATWFAPLTSPAPFPQQRNFSAFCNSGRRRPARLDSRFWRNNRLYLSIGSLRGRIV